MLTGDDLGQTSETNQAIVWAHREGVLTSTSLVAAGKAAPEAVSLARDLPSLAVGLHLVRVGGPAVLAPPSSPHLVDRNGRFPRAAVQIGLK